MKYDTFDIPALVVDRQTGTKRRTACTSEQQRVCDYMLNKVRQPGNTFLYIVYCKPSTDKDRIEIRIAYPMSCTEGDMDANTDTFLDYEYRRVVV
jgi:hypothetical protein